MSRTNIDIDDGLIEEAGKLTHIKTKKELVNMALKEIIMQHKRKKLLKLCSQGVWEGNLDEWRKVRF